MEMSDYYVARMSTWDSIYRYPEGEKQQELSPSDNQRYFILREHHSSPA